MRTNDLKKGDNVILRNGWKAVIEDNKKGNTRLAKVFGTYTELGSVYSWDIMEVIKDGQSIKIQLTDLQLKTQKIASMFF